MVESATPYYGPKGSCGTCGFLCKYSPSNIPVNFFEASYYDRKTGRTETSFPDLSSGPIQTQLTCYRAAANLEEEIQNLRSEKVLNNAFTSIHDVTKEIMRKDRKCGKWMEYIHGLSPIEHLREWKMNELELRREQFEQRMERERKEFDLQLNRDNKNFQKALDRSNKKFTYAIVIFTLLSVIAALIPAAFPNGWPWLMEKFHSNPAPTKPQPLNIPGGF